MSARRGRGDSQGASFVVNGQDRPEGASRVRAVGRAPIDVAGSGDHGEPLLAYLFLRRHAGTHTRAVLEGHVRTFALREGYVVAGVIVAAEDAASDASTSDGTDPGFGILDRPRSLQELARQLEKSGARKVLVVGPARQALVFLHGMSAIQILTLAHVQPLRLHRGNAGTNRHGEKP